MREVYIKHGTNAISNGYSEQKINDWILSTYHIPSLGLRAGWLRAVKKKEDEYSRLVPNIESNQKAKSLTTFPANDSHMPMCLDCFKIQAY